MNSLIVLRLGQWMSDPLCRMEGMKNIFFRSARVEAGELVATFGQARLMKLQDGRFELRGGSAEERFEAKEWASLFMHEAVVDGAQRLVMQ
jgi:hypothetical protein